MEFRQPKVTCDANTGVVVETVGVNKGGGVGSLDLIDEEIGQNSKTLLQKLQIYNVEEN